MEKTYINSVIMTRSDGELQIYDRFKIENDENSDDGIKNYIYLEYPEIISKLEALSIGWTPHERGDSVMSIREVKRY